MNEAPKSAQKILCFQVFACLGEWGIFCIFGFTSKVPPPKHPTRIFVLSHSSHTVHARTMIYMRFFGNRLKINVFSGFLVHREVYQKMYFWCYKKGTPDVTLRGFFTRLRSLRIPRVRISIFGQILYYYWFICRMI